MLSAKLGHFLDKPLKPVARRIRLTPNFFTAAGFLITVRSEEHTSELQSH